MAIVSKAFIHKESKLVGASGSSDGVLPEDVQDWISANGGSIDGSSNLNITCTALPASRIFTLIVIDNNA